ncbi:hypothetical protein ACOME3_010763 [Neoechinorhynchus agilis]
MTDQSSSTSPKQSNRISKYDPSCLFYPLASGNNAGQSECSFSPTDQFEFADNLTLVSMISAMIALVFKFKWLSWISLMSSIISFVNSRISDQTRQACTCLILALSSMMACYFYDPSPLVSVFTDTSSNDESITI